jgi:hypothetical protein
MTNLEMDNPQKSQSLRAFDLPASGAGTPYALAQLLVFLGNAFVILGLFLPWLQVGFAPKVHVSGYRLGIFLAQGSPLPTAWGARNLWDDLLLILALVLAVDAALNLVALVRGTSFRSRQAKLRMGIGIALGVICFLAVISTFAISFYLNQSWDNYIQQNIASLRNLVDLIPPFMLDALNWLGLDLQTMVDQVVTAGETFIIDVLRPAATIGSGPLVLFMGGTLLAAGGFLMRRVARNETVA